MVNCVMGWSRSATVVMAYLIAKKGYRINEALEAIRRFRPKARPNPGFMQQLVEFEAYIKKNR